jgi:poly(rC)-binding protein 2/3/4
MSASPTTQSAKRPLEDPSSPNGQAEQPDAKRPAIEKVVKEEEAKTSEEPTTETESPEASTNGTNGVKKEETKTEESTPAAPVEAASQHVDESAWIHIRSVISSAEAATVIGKGGENVTRIRQMSGAKCTVSDYQKGAVERILTVSGAVEAVAKAFGLIIRTLNNEPLDAPSTPQSKQYPLRLLVPHILIGAIIGKGGSRIREIQEQSGARLNASESCLPLSTERQLHREQ